MILDVEFLKEGNAVYATRVDMGVMASQNPLSSIGFLTAKFNLKAKIDNGQLTEDAANWDQVSIGGKVYARPKESTPLPQSQPVDCMKYFK